MADSTARNRAAKPRFPLWLHTGTGQWAKKIRGHRYYFGTDQAKALAEYSRVREDLEAGRIPRPPDGQELTLKQLCNLFLTDRKSKLQSGELARRSFDCYYKTCERLLNHFGRSAVVSRIRTSDLTAYRTVIADGKSPNTIQNEVIRTRTILTFAFENDLVDRPIRFGGFKPPAKKVHRRHRAAAGPRIFTAEEIRKLLDNASPALRAMILLAINGGFGNEDCARLTTDQINGHWYDSPRAKTGIDRKFPLWAETREAINKVLDGPRHPDYPTLIFITTHGNPWFPLTGRQCTAIGHEFDKLKKKAGITRKGLTFYRLRHTFQTVADQIGDYIATKIIMGHVDDSISGVYRQQFPDKSLQRVTNHVHAWLFGEGVRDE